MYVELATQRIVSQGEIRNAFPNVSFPSADFVPPEGYAEVESVPVPSYDAFSHEVVPGEPQQDILGNWSETWVVRTLPDEQLAANRQAMARQIDDAVQAVYDKPMRLAREYETREAEAIAYKAAKDAAQDLPACPRVQGFASAEGLSLDQAVTVTLQQAAALRGALAVLSDVRMTKRYVTRSDVSFAMARAKHQQAMATIAQIRQQLG